MDNSNRPVYDPEKAERAKKDLLTERSHIIAAVKDPELRLALETVECTFRATEIEAELVADTRQKLTDITPELHRIFTREHADLDLSDRALMRKYNTFLTSEQTKENLFTCQHSPGPEDCAVMLEILENDLTPDVIRDMGFGKRLESIFGKFFGSAGVMLIPHAGADQFEVLRGQFANPLSDKFYNASTYITSINRRHKLASDVITDCSLELNSLAIKDFLPLYLQAATRCVTELYDKLCETGAINIDPKHMKDEHMEVIGDSIGTRIFTHLGRDPFEHFGLQTLNKIRTLYPEALYRPHGDHLKESNIHLGPYKP